MLLSPCAVFVFNSAFVFVLTWLFLGCHPRQWPGARPSAPAYRAPSRPSPATKGSTFWWRKFSTDEKSKVRRISPPRTAIGQLWSRSPLTWRSPNIHTTWAPERLKWFFSKWLQKWSPPTHPLTHQPSRESPHNQFFGVGIVILFFHKDHQRPKNSSCRSNI